MPSVSGNTWSLIEPVGGAEYGKAGRVRSKSCRAAGFRCLFHFYLSDTYASECASGTILPDCFAKIGFKTTSLNLNSTSNCTL